MTPPAAPSKRRLSHQAQVPAESSKMAIQRACGRLLLALLLLIKLSSEEHAAGAARLLAKRHEKDFPPRLTHQPPDARAKPREPHTVECPVESQPESEVKWFKDGQVLTSEPAHVEQTGSELMFFQISPADTGDYHCEAQNYLGRAASEPFRLTVQSTSVQDESILMEPPVYLAADQQDWPAEFRCTIPVLLLGRTSKLWQTSRPEQFVKWQRNGRPLAVAWAAPAAPAESERRGFRARQSERNPNEFVLSLARPTRAQDHNSTFSCLLKWDEDLVDEEARESRPALLKFEPPKQPVKLDIPMGAPMDIESEADGASDSRKLKMQTLDRERARPGNQSQTTQLGELGGAGRRGDARIRTSLADTLSDLYQIAKPTLILFGVLSLVAVIVLLQFLFARRRAQANRYMKHHHQYSSSASSAASGLCNAGGAPSDGSGTGSALGDCDPVLSSLLARTLSAPSANSLGAGATKKYKFYRDQMRGKVAAAGDNHLGEEPQQDFIDAAAYFAAATAAQQQQQPLDCQQAALFAANNPAVPNLYNQSLAAREQARSLLQAGEHVRSMGNLTSSSQLHRLEHPLSKQHELLMSGSQQRPGDQPFELPVNFANSFSTGGPLESGAASLLQHHRSMAAGQQLPAWAAGQQHLLLPTHQSGQHHHQKQAMAGEQYQLVSCSSISPSSTSSVVAGSNSSAGSNAHQEEETTTTSRARQPARQQASLQRDSTSNHYSVIENNDDELEAQREEEEDGRYEELDAREFQRSSARSSTASSVENCKSTFGPSKASSFATSGAQRKTSNHQLKRTAIESGAPASSRHAGVFGSRRAKTDQRKLTKDQLSPYAVSSICHGQPPPPPPVSSEAMRALNEQFEISQLVLLDAGCQPSRSLACGSSQVQLPFDLPPPPPPPTSAEFGAPQGADTQRATNGKRAR